MNTIEISNEICKQVYALAEQKYMSEMLVHEEIFPEVKIKCHTTEDKPITFKIKFLDGTYHFQARSFGEHSGAKWKTGFEFEYNPKASKHKRICYTAINDNDIYGYMDVFKALSPDVGNPDIVFSHEYCERFWKNEVQEQGAIIIAIFYLMMNWRPEERTVERKEYGPSGKSKERVIRPKIDGNKTYLFNDIVHYIGHKRKRQSHEIHCDCWEVRGHYRHYQNGKTVFIPAYKKGKNRGQKKQDKTYKWE